MERDLQGPSSAEDYLAPNSDSEKGQPDLNAECSLCGARFHACSPQEHLCDGCYFGVAAAVEGYLAPDERLAKFGRL